MKMKKAILLFSFTLLVMTSCVWIGEWGDSEFLPRFSVEVAGGELIRDRSAVKAVVRAEGGIITLTTLKHNWWLTTAGPFNGRRLKTQRQVEWLHLNSHPVRDPLIITVDTESEESEDYRRWYLYVRKIESDYFAITTIEGTPKKLRIEMFPNTTGRINQLTIYLCNIGNLSIPIRITQVTE